MTARPEESVVRPFTGRHMLIILVCFFGLIATMNLVFAWLALGSWPGLLEQNGYQGSQSYNQQIAESKVQQQLGWHSDISYADGAIILKVENSESAGISGLDIAANIGRPTNELANRILSLGESTGGYSAVTDLDDGIWIIGIRARRGSEIIYRRNFRIYVRDGAG